MDPIWVEYKGCIILPMPVAEREGRYHGGYAILKNGQLMRVRRDLFPGCLYRKVALKESIEYAKLEIDNLSA